MRSIISASSLRKRFARDKRGSTAVEFGIVVVPFVAILVAIFEIAYVNLERELLVGALNKASRAMMTGNLQSNAAVTNAATFVQNYLCPTTGARLVPSNFDCTKLIVDVRPVTGSVTPSDLTNDIYKTTTEFCPGQAGQIVLMRVAYPLPAIFPVDLFNAALGVVRDVPGQAGSFHVLMASALFTEEAFQQAYTPPSGC